MKALTLPALLLLSVACRREAASPPPVEQGPPPTNRIDVPEPVRRNLGIRFAVLELRRVATSLRFPGDFELLPSAQAPMAKGAARASTMLHAMTIGDLDEPGMILTPLSSLAVDGTAAAGP